MTMDDGQQAPGAPGAPPSWTTGAKDGVGTALDRDCSVWFTLSHGILNEIYFPYVDTACTRDLGFIVTDGRDFFSEEKRHTRSEVDYLADGVPAFRVTNTCEQGRYRIEKEILTDPRRDVLLQQVRFTALRGRPDDYHLYVLLAPHLDDRGRGNDAWVGDYKGVPMLFACRADNCLALAGSMPWAKRSAGFVGVSDGWQDLSRHKRMTWEYGSARGGNVALTGEIDLAACGGSFVLALGLGHTFAEAGQLARASLFDGFDSARTKFIKQWRKWQKSLLPVRVKHPRTRQVYRVSAAVLRTHEAKNCPGAFIASLSVPWGFAHGDRDAGGYHLVWVRDMTETAGGLMAVREQTRSRIGLLYLHTTQEDDGSWPQNMWLDGSSYWKGLQMDEVADAVLHLDLARREGLLQDGDLERFWPMARRAAEFLVRNGPATEQDRWEENPGYCTSTLAAEVAGLLVAADLADRQGEPGAAAYLRETADAWNDGIEEWTYARGGALCERYGVDGYYVRITPPAKSHGVPSVRDSIRLSNHPKGQELYRADQIVGTDPLALVRYGLRDPNDPKVLNTVRVIDALLKVDLPQGPSWHRFNHDGYGEHADGAPFDGTGVGRVWPLLVGERAHYELAAGRQAEAERLLHAMEAFATDTGLIPEQTWDAADLPARGLYRGRPTGSGMPLVWAHAEYVKLCRSLRDGRVFDMPPQTVKRYLKEKTTSPRAVWRFTYRRPSLPAGKTLRIELLAPAVVHWSADGWGTTHDLPTRDTGLGIHLADLPTDRLPGGAEVVFTFRWDAGRRWEGTDFRVTVGQLSGNGAPRGRRSGAADAAEKS